MKFDSKIFVAGHLGLVGSSLVRRLRKEGYNNLILKDRHDLDLTSSHQVHDFFDIEKPEYVFLAAAKCGGVGDNNNNPVPYLLDNLQIQNNVIQQSYEHNVEKLLFLGSSCIYPTRSPQPIKEEYLLSDYLEPTNEPYAIAKIAGIKLCQAYVRQFGCNYISLQPCNVYGLSDNFNQKSGHVIASLISKFHEAKINNAPSVSCWGTGEAKREFICSDDLADACIFLMNNYNDPDIINVGTGVEYSIKELVEKVKDVVGYTGTVEWDHTKPNGMMRRLLDNTKLNNLGWKPSVSFDDGLRLTYKNYEVEMN